MDIFRFACESARKIPVKENFFKGYRRYSAKDFIKDRFNALKRR